MRNDKKLIMFDFGGVTEIHDKGRSAIYDYIPCICDAIRYATECRFRTGDGTIRDSNKYLWGKLSEDVVSDKIFRSISNIHDLSCVFGSWLCNMANDSSVNAVYYTERFVEYVNDMSRLTPYDGSIIRLQKKLIKDCLVGAMTNIGWFWSPRFHELTDSIGYDVIWESFKMGFLKPELEAFKSVEALTGLEGTQILLFDDTWENVKAAREAGWYAYQVPRENAYLCLNNVSFAFLHDDTSLLMPLLETEASACV